MPSGSARGLHSSRGRLKNKRGQKANLLDKYDLEIKRLQDGCADPELLKAEASLFEQLPLSDLTKKGLKACGYTDLTEIQKRSLPYSLSGRDVLGAAKTGSGKTLSFLIPVLESLYKFKWTKMDGLGALIITPTRELAYQIFDILRKVGRHHSFSAGLMFGGKDMETEKERLSEINIVIATPGRLLSHMDQTSDFVYDNLQILVLDEADRCLDEGFERTLKAIISGLPKNRQTLLFSATQRKSLSALALLSLKNPEYISVVDQSDHHTPDQLVQKYTVCDDGEKLNILCSFIKSHKKMKILVFVSSCKQARFIYEVFCKLQPGIIISCLHGRQKQTKRLEVFSEFSRKSAICLISTDIASRGLDFPAVDWVFQLDCPEDTDTYIHRVGRTARYNSDGNSLLLLSKTEESGIVEKLRKQKVPIMKTSIKSSKLTNIAPSIQALCTQFPEIKYLAQRAIASYVRGVHLRRDKSTFNVSSISVASLAKSYGLESIPKIRILKSRSSVKNVSRDLENVYKLDDNESIRNGARDVSERGGALPLLNGLRKSRAKYEPTQSESTESSVGHNKEKDPSRDDGIIVLKRKHDEIDIPEAQEKVTMPVNHRKILKLRRREIKNRGTGRHVKFDLDGNATESLKFKSVQSFASEKTLDARRMEYIEKAAKFIEAEDKIDKETARALLREKRARKKLKRSEMV